MICGNLGIQGMETARKFVLQKRGDETMTNIVPDLRQKELI